MQCC